MQLKLGNSGYVLVTGVCQVEPETSREMLLSYAYDGPRRLAVVEEACRVGADALRYLSALNEPLTQGELSAWDGRPAWIVPLGERPWAAQWSIMQHGAFYVKARKEMGIEITTQLRRDRYGETWMAYRSPPEGDET